MRVLEMDFTLTTNKMGIKVYRHKLPCLGASVWLAFDKNGGICESPDNPPGKYVAWLSDVTDTWRGARSMCGAYPADTPEEAVRDMEQRVKDELAHRRAETLKFENLTDAMVTALGGRA